GAGEVEDKTTSAANDAERWRVALAKALQMKFWRRSMLRENRGIPVVARLVLFVGIISLAGCNKVEKPSFRVFASPDDAGNALIEAAKSGDQNAALAIFGADSKEIIFSADAVEDKALIDAFVRAYGVMHRWRKMPD